jgi:UDP-4-amino-4-deoxy-L-arabinose formyltransferase/UDP-glucuronic acid dehydrogenase (UDP-4-keto-hexauronic acid decarboxylating)
MAGSGIAQAPCVVFAYQEMGYECLRVLFDLEAPIKALFTHEDHPAEEIWWHSCAALARARSIPVFTDTDKRVDQGLVKRIATMEPAIIYSFYYRHLLSDSILNLASRGAFNLHGSLLQAYRGRAPVNWVLVNGESKTGITLHHMVARADAGDIVAQREIPIDDSDTALSLYRKMVPAGADLIRRMHPLIATGVAPRSPQDLLQGSYFGRRRPEDGRIDWNWPARRVFNLVRGVTHPYPGAFCSADGRKLLVWSAAISSEDGNQAAPGTILRRQGDSIEVACGAGVVRLLTVQFESKGEGAAGDILASIGRL